VGKVKYHRSITKEEKRQIGSDLDLYRDGLKQRVLTSGSDCDTITRALLDSSLISQTNSKMYQVKIVECGNYVQVYDYNHYKVKKEKLLVMNPDYYFRSKKNIVMNDNIDIDHLDEWGSHTTLFESGAIKLTRYTPFGIERVLKICFENPRAGPDKKIIETRNINRAKHSLQRLIKSNESRFKTFVTLTFAENIRDVEVAHSKFNIWRTYIKRLKSDFCYVAVPEFQKRGAVHYHLLTNIDYTDFSLLSKELVVTYSTKSHSYDTGRTIKGWKYGFSKVKDMDNVNVVGYLTKYLTKDLDNRLWGKRRYYYSQNLLKPNEILLDLSNMNDFRLYIDVLDNKKVYESIYCDQFGQIINFYEYKKGV